MVDPRPRAGLRRVAGGRRAARHRRREHGRRDALLSGPGRHPGGRESGGRADRETEPARRARRARRRDHPGQPRAGRHRGLRAPADRPVPAHRGRDRRGPSAVPGGARERARRVAGGGRLRRRGGGAGRGRAGRARLRAVVRLPAGRRGVVRASLSRGHAGGDQRRADRPRAQGHRQARCARIEPHPGRRGGGRHPGLDRAGDRPRTGARGRCRRRDRDFRGAGPADRPQGGRLPGRVGHRRSVALRPAHAARPPGPLARPCRWFSPSPTAF